MSVLRNFEGLMRDVFIETGTGDGATTLSAAMAGFPEVHTIEQHLPTWEGAFRAFDLRIDNADNTIGERHVKLTVHLGLSIEVLPRIMNPTKATTFWLDAHYSGQTMPADHEWYGGIECPLLSELALIRAVPWETKPLVLIDDAIMFTHAFWATEDSHRFKADEWPRLHDIREVLPDHMVVPHGEYLVLR